MHIFISAGEPSGDLHGASLARGIHDGRGRFRAFKGMHQ